jgi:predicted small integral membrane protein
MNLFFFFNLANYSSGFHFIQNNLVMDTFIEKLEIISNNVECKLRK